MVDSKDYVRQIDSEGFARRRNFWGRIHLDPWMLMLLLTLFISGLFVLYSASDEGLMAVKRQIRFFAVGLVVMVIVANVPMLFYRRVAPVIYLVGLVLLVLVIIMGTGAKGAQRWLAIPGVIRFQPSEILKLVMPLTVAWYLSARALPPKPKYVFAVMAIVFVPTLLIAAQPDLGTSILVASSGIFVLLLAGLSFWYLLGGAAVLAAAAYPMWHFGLREYQRGRILTLLDPERDKFGAGWNIIQSKTAIGSGGLHGKGWFEGTQSQLNFLPESHTDFIIAVLAEEFGFVGVMLLLGLYLAIVARGMVIAWTATTNFNKLVAGSVTLTFFVYIFVNMGMVSGLLPVVGVPLPLVSRGGTSIVTLMAGFGLIMAAATDKQQFAK
ncbi:Peptidoglycan glycosyltransferase MrdB [BD1-7 clade bacterium]|uniref:Peptidoglycan glycosyltransferase MrdB n=1 Tax=BD1-7 clade bacterium TaxID=2029982 RepID=A0A5S9PUV8_9GAMM|nr:Peptidoglycan glycosyltransferase MrdB [BD1-7 clade bacterium]